jgi:type IV secretory pathway VirB10-like protein
MNEARYASLSSGLLARKGTAKPAMRPQGFTHIEDLGWNDMGYATQPQEQEIHEVEAPEHVPSSIAALTPAPKQVRPEIEADEPPVVAQRRVIAESFDTEEAEEPEVVETEAEMPKRKRVKAQVVTLPKRAVEAVGKKAAFTLRLDADRHLRLRLACAVTGRSAQQIVTGALDEMLASLPEVEALAARVPATGAGRS